MSEYEIIEAMVENMIEKIIKTRLTLKMKENYEQNTIIIQLAFDGKPIGNNYNLSLTRGR